MTSPTRVYGKPALSEGELLARWRQRGMEIPDERRAQRYLRHIGYYRLSAYVRSFEGAERDVLRPGTSFDDVLELYVFDRKLRLHLMDAVERVEVALRAALNDRMSAVDGPHWYENGAHFKVHSTHAKLLRDIDDILNQQRKRRPERGLTGERFESALDHYVTHYDTPRRPPTWIVLEELSFGITRAVYEALADSEIQSSIAKSLGTQAPVLSSWLRSYQRVRNICAHHGRLWNRGIGVYPKVPRSSSIRWLNDSSVFVTDPWRRQRLYPVLVSLQTILHTISPRSSWGRRLHELLDAYPKVPMSALGIPDGWFDDPFWETDPR